MSDPTTDEPQGIRTMAIGGPAIDLSTLHGAHMLRARLSAGRGILVMEESADSFAADIVAVAVYNGYAPSAGVARTWRASEWPVSRLGAAGIAMRARCATGGISGVVELVSESSYTEAMQPPPPPEALRTEKTHVLAIGGAALDVSTLHAPALLRLTATAGPGILVIEESSDAFSHDVVPVALYNGAGSLAGVVHTWRDDQWPVSRLGTADVTMRARAIGALVGTLVLVSQADPEDVDDAPPAPPQ